MTNETEPLGFVVELRRKAPHFARRVEFLANGHRTCVQQWGRAAWCATADDAQRACADYTAFWGRCFVGEQLVVRAVRQQGSRRRLAEEVPTC